MEDVLQAEYSDELSVAYGKVSTGCKEKKSPTSHIINPLLSTNVANTKSPQLLRTNLLNNPYI